MWWHSLIIKTFFLNHLILTRFLIILTNLKHLIWVLSCWSGYCSDFKLATPLSSITLIHEGQTEQKYEVSVIYIKREIDLQHTSSVALSCTRGVNTGIMLLRKLLGSEQIGIRASHSARHFRNPFSSSAAGTTVLIFAKHSTLRAIWFEYVGSSRVSIP